MVFAVRHEPYLELDPDWVVKKAGGPRSQIDCFGILSDDKIRRYFELGCEVKGLGRGHVKRIKEEVRSQSTPAATDRARPAASRGEQKKGKESMKKALITGITGQDGSYLAEFLLCKGLRGPRPHPPGQHLQHRPDRSISSRTSMTRLHTFSCITATSPFPDS